MRAMFSSSGSIRDRLLLSLLIMAAILAWLLFVAVRSVANQAVEATQDNVLGAAAQAILEEMRGSEEGVSVDIPYTAFSILGAIGEDRVFYRILVGEDTVTGYEDLPVTSEPSGPLRPRYYSADYKGENIRLAAASRQFLIDSRLVEVTVVLGQTQSAKVAIVSQMMPRAAVLGFGFFALAAVFALLATRSVLRPISNLAEAVGRRGPQDLRSVQRPVPVELKPFVAALNGFIDRLANALSRTETFIAEAAHHIRTPLATLRANVEVALRQTSDPELQERLRSVIRSVDDSARSASQMLDHAAVSYRTDQRADEKISLNQILPEISEAFRPGGEMKDVRIFCTVPEEKAVVLADHVLIETAVRNLLDNAVKYSPEGCDVDVRLTAENGWAHIQVLDRGRGLGGKSGVDLTRRFARGGNVQDVVGTGLGLTIVREVARALKGRFRIYDREGGGACADLSLPLHFGSG